MACKLIRRAHSLIRSLRSLIGMDGQEDADDGQIGSQPNSHDDEPITIHQRRYRFTPPLDDCKAVLAVVNLRDGGYGLRLRAVYGDASRQDALVDVVPDGHDLGDLMVQRMDDRLGLGGRDGARVVRLHDGVLEAFRDLLTRFRAPPAAAGRHRISE